MADRTVSVELELKVDRYKVEAEEAKRSTEGIDDKVKKTKDDLDKTATAATRAAATLRLLGTESGTSRIALEDAGAKGSTAVKQIDTRLIEARAHVKLLADEFNKTGSFDVFGKLAGAQKDVKSLEQIGKDLTSALESGAQDAEPALNAFAKSLMTSLADLPAQLQAAAMATLVTVAVAAAPLIVAAANGAILSVIGGGAIALGIAGQLHNPMLHAAATDFGNELKQTLTASTIGFAGPLTTALGVLTTALRTIGPSLASTLAPAAQAIEPLAQGLSHMALNIMPGLRAALAASLPILLILAKSLPQLGSAISDMFASMAKGSKGAGEGLQTIMMLIEAVIRVTGGFIMQLSMVYQAAIAFGDDISGVLQKIFGWIPLIGGNITAAHNKFDEIRGAEDSAGQSTDDLSNSFKGLSGNTDAAAASAQDLQDQINATNTAFDRMFGIVQNSRDAVVGMKQQFADLEKNLKSGKDAINDNTQAGRDNILMVDQAASSILAVRDANVAAGMKVEDANALYLKQIDALSGVLSKAGFTRQQIEALVGTYKTIPAAVGTNITTNGLNSALDNAIALHNALDGINGHYYTATIHVVRTGASATAFASGGIRRAATGLIVGPSDPGTLIGEPQTGGEALIPLRGITAGSAAALGEIAMSGYGMTVVPRGAAGSGGGATMLMQPLTIALPSGEPLVRTIITYALDTGRSPAQLFPAAAR